MKYVIAALSGVLFLILFCYLAFLYNWTPVIPSVYPQDMINSHMDTHSVTASALQESAGLLTTLSLALAALFGFSVGRNFDKDNWQLYVSIILTIVFAVCLKFSFSVYAYGVYRAIAVQTDRGLFFA